VVGIGPAEDGGYLLGLKRNNPLIFQKNKNWEQIQSDNEGFKRSSNFSFGDFKRY
jgi:glycosyltransferase A (GT-A) superfamily protein (DUF2064 family)